LGLHCRLRRAAVCPGPPRARSAASASSAPISSAPHPAPRSRARCVFVTSTHLCA